MSAFWQIHLLGSLEVYRDHRVLPSFPTRKAKSLFAYLVFNSHRTWSRDTLAQTLWPDVSGASARKCLRNEFWRIRQVLSSQDVRTEDNLLIDGRSVRFEASQNVWIDVVQLEKALDGNGGGMIGQLSEAADLYRGDFLEDSDEEWCYGPRERLRQAFLTILEQLVDHNCACANWQTAIACAQRILSCDPLLEHIQRKLMLCYWRLGNRTAALRQYGECADLLMRELAVKPMPETLEIFRCIQAHDRELLYPEDVPGSRPEVGQLLSRLDLLERHLEESVRSLRREILALDPPPQPLSLPRRGAAGRGFQASNLRQTSRR